MNFTKTVSLAIVSGLLIISAASSSARAAMTDTGSVNAKVALAADPSPAANVEHSWLMPSAENRVHQSMNCKPGHIFSQHDVVGDPESCIMQGAGYGVGAHGYGAIPAL